MSEKVVKFSNVENKIIPLRNCQTLLDYDVAELYGVETKRINEAVKNNPEKFPKGYFFEVTADELKSLRSNFSTLKTEGRDNIPNMRPRLLPRKDFMILKSERATQTTIAIVETFAKIRELARTTAELSESRDQFSQKLLMQKSGDIIAELLGEDLQTSDTETGIELNLAVLKFKHTIKRKKE